MSLKLLSQKFYSILNLSASVSFQLQTAQLVNHIMKFLVWIFGFGPLRPCCVRRRLNQQIWIKQFNLCQVLFMWWCHITKYKTWKRHKLKSCFWCFWNGFRKGRHSQTLWSSEYAFLHFYWYLVWTPGCPLGSPHQSRPRTTGKKIELKLENLHF